MYIIPQVKTQNVKSCISNCTITPLCIISWWIGFVSEQSFRILFIGPWKNLQRLFTAELPQRKSSFLSVFLGVWVLITQRRLSFPLTRSINRVEAQGPQAITSNTPSRCWLSFLRGLSSTWIPSATSGPSVGLTCEANCTGHIHPLLKASLKPQSQQLTAGMDVSFSTSPGELINRKIYIWSA